MTAPRPVFPERFLFVTRRCTQREFLLRPDDATNNAFTYLLAEASKRFGVEVILEQMMSNHHHTALWDPFGRHVEFREHFHKLVAKSQNALRGRWENLWSSEEPCVVEVLTREDLLEKLVYIATNPVKDGLVEKVHHWPGPKFVHALLSGKPMRAKRPPHFFRDDGPMPPELELVLKLPDHVEGKQEFLHELRRRIAQVEEACAQERRANHRCVLGRRSILRQNPRANPSSFEPRRNLRPGSLRVTSGRASRRFSATRSGSSSTATRESTGRPTKPPVFPYGTHALRRLAGVHVKPPPKAN